MEGSRADRLGRSARDGGEAGPSAALDAAQLVDLTHDAMLLRSFSDGRILLWNRGAERMYGWPASEALGKIGSELLRSRYPRGLAAIEDELSRSGRWEGILHRKTREGTTVTVLARWVIHRTAAGEPDSILEVNTDLTRQAEAGLRLGASEELLELLVSCVQDYAIFTLDQSGHIASWNKGAGRIKGYAAEEIIGRHFSIFYPEEDVRAGKPDWELAVAADAGRFEDEGWRVRKDGSQFWANVIITALRDSSGVLRGFGKVTRDLTERRRAELERLDEERRQAETYREQAHHFAELERIKTEFLNLASHELRGPLAVARGYVSLLIEGSIGPEGFLAYAGIVESKLAQIEWLVQKMLETARLEYEQLDLIVKDVDLLDLVQQQIDAVRPLLTPDHTLTLDVRTEGAPTVSGDSVRLGTAILNLLDNAIKYSPGGGPIGVKVESESGWVSVSVCDQGMGIDGEDLAKLFTRFTRLHLEETANIAGTGLGLYLAREIARRHGGDIAVASTRGRGSKFTLRLPLATAAAGVPGVGVAAG